MIRTSLIVLALLGTLAPLVPAAAAEDWCCLPPVCLDSLGCPPCLDACICLDCIFPCLSTQQAEVCVYRDWSTGCYVATATVHERTYVVSSYVPPQEVSTKPIHVGPVHVDSITVSTDPVTVGPYFVTTPGRSVSNTLCPDGVGLA